MLNNFIVTFVSMNRLNINLEQAEFLRCHGFEILWPDEQDLNYCYYQLLLHNHKYLNSLRLVVDGKAIDVWCREHKRGLTPGQEVLVASKPFTAPNLRQLLLFCKNE